MVVELRRAEVQSEDLIGDVDRQNFVPTGQRAQGHQGASTSPFLLEEALYQASLMQV